MSRVFIRFALPRDVDRFVSDGILTGPPPPNETWNDRAKLWIAEQQAGRRYVLVAEDVTGLLGTVQLVMRFPPGYSDNEAANGMDVAMMELLRTRSGAPQNTANQLVIEVQNIAKKRNIKTLTFLLPLDNNRAIAQAKSWGFEEFRIMPERTGMLAFFRKAID